MWSNPYALAAAVAYSVCDGAHGSVTDDVLDDVESAVTDDVLDDVESAKQPICKIGAFRILHSKCCSANFVFINIY